MSPRLLCHHLSAVSEHGFQHFATCTLCSGIQERQATTTSTCPTFATWPAASSPHDPAAGGSLEEETLHQFDFSEGEEGGKGAIGGQVCLFYHYHHRLLTFRSLCTMPFMWQWFTLSRICCMQWLWREQPRSKRERKKGEKCQETKETRKRPTKTQQHVKQNFIDKRKVLEEQFSLL